MFHTTFMRNKLCTKVPKVRAAEIFHQKLRILEIGSVLSDALYQPPTLWKNWGETGVARSGCSEVFFANPNRNAFTEIEHRVRQEIG